MGNTRSSPVVTIQDVALEANVSIATVSRAINNSGYVSPEKHARIIQAMSRLGYAANPQARSLAGGKSQTIGVLIWSFVDPLLDNLMQGIETELAASNYDLLLYTTRRRKTKEAAYVTTLTRGLADGLILNVPANTEAYLSVLQQRHFPHVLIDKQVEDEHTSFVASKNWEGAFAAMRYLIELGHRRIGFIAGSPEMVSAQERLAAYQAALTEYGLPIDEALIQPGNYEQSRAFVSAGTLLALAEPPTAIFAANDLAAFGAMEAVRDHGLRMPDDISILGFDDVPQASHVHPALTTVRQDVEQIGRLAARILLDTIAQPERPAEHVEVATTLIIRGSCQAPRTRSAIGSI